MTLGQKMLIIWGLAAAIAFVVVEPWQSPGKRGTGWAATSASVIRVFVALIAAALMIVGVVSNTLVIHAVQITPLVMVAALFSSKPDWSAIAAVPLFAFWLLIMGGIWLFLLGISRFFTGTFSPVEIFLTFVIGGVALAGLATTNRHRPALPVAIRLVTVVVVGALQSAALWFSYHPMVVAR